MALSTNSDMISTTTLQWPNNLNKKRQNCSDVWKSMEILNHLNNDCSCRSSLIYLLYISFVSFVCYTLFAPEVILVGLETSIAFLETACQTNITYAVALSVLEDQIKQWFTHLNVHFLDACTQPHTHTNTDHAFDGIGTGNDTDFVRFNAAFSLSSLPFELANWNFRFISLVLLFTFSLCVFLWSFFFLLLLPQTKGFFFWNITMFNVSATASVIIIISTLMQLSLRPFVTYFNPDVIAQSFDQRAKNTKCALILQPTDRRRKKTECVRCCF